MSASTPNSDDVVAVDTSVAVPLLMQRHTAHAEVSRWARGRSLALSGHAGVETYSVLTRLPADARLDPHDAVTLMDASFTRTLTLPARSAARVPRDLATIGVAGGAAYDALVALAARAHGVPLATRDSRALATYHACGVDVIVVEDSG